MAIEEKDRDDVMDRLLQLGGDKKFLSYDDLNRELPENVVSPDDIEDVLQKLDASNIHVADSDERLIEQAAAIAEVLREADAYPFCQKYRYWPGPNSNTFAAWVLRKAGVEHKLGPMALGKRYPVA